MRRDGPKLVRSQNFLALVHIVQLAEGLLSEQDTLMVSQSGQRSTWTDVVNAKTLLMRNPLRTTTAAIFVEYPLSLSKLANLVSLLRQLISSANATLGTVTTSLLKP